MTHSLRKGRSIAAALFISAAFGLGLFSAVSNAVAQSTDAKLIERGKYLLHAGGCISCHRGEKKDDPFLAGGYGLKTPFGTIYAPNITPDPEHGIGGWSERDFARAMRQGISPDGSHYFPAFPYPAFTGMSDADIGALKAYLDTVTPVSKPNRPNEIGFPFNIRFFQTFWKLLYFEDRRFEPDPAKSAEINRGAYLAEVLGHCGECHTPRNALGGLNRDYWMAGSDDGAEGDAVPNITPAPKTGIADWEAGDIVQYLSIGMTPTGDFAGSLMTDVIEHNTSKLTEADVAAIAAYLKDLPPIERTRKSKTP